VTQEVIPKNCQIKRGVVNEDGQPFYKLLQLCLGEYLQLQFMFMDEGWTDKRFDFKMYFIGEFSVINTCIGHHTVLKVIPIRKTHPGTVPTSIRRVVLVDHGG
jgi:hypothetical protein